MKKTGKPDYKLLFLVLLLITVGLVTLYSTSSYNGNVRFGDKSYYLKKQLFATVLGMMVMFLVSKTDYHYFLKNAPVGYIISIFLSTAVLFWGKEINGSKRWLSFGPLSFQPSEFAKPAMILFLAWQMEQSKNDTMGIWFMVKTMCSLLPIVALVGTNNLSTAIIILGIGAFLIFVSSPKYLQFILLGLSGIGFMGIFLAAESYRLERLAVWRNPEKYEKGFQTIQGLYAIGSGGIFGRGLGNGIQKLGFVPEAQNDMIFSIICEETGLFGAGILMGIFLLMIWRLAVIAMQTREQAGAFVVAGIMGHMAIQVILNIAVVTNTIPNTGITLPFISYGGTSVLFLLSEMGIALNISSQQKKMCIK